MSQVQSALTKYAMEVQRIADEEKAAKRLITGWETDIQAKQKAYAELPEAASGEGETWTDTKGRKYGDKDTGRIANQHLRTIEELQQR